MNYLNIVKSVSTSKYEIAIAEHEEGYVVLHQIGEKQVISSNLMDYNLANSLFDLILAQIETELH